MAPKSTYATPATVLILLWLLLAIAFIFFIVLVVRALLKYINNRNVRHKKQTTRDSLGKAIKSHRISCQMTQEFVADALGVSRQAVSRWENGSSDPSTSNLIALTKLFGISPEELLHDVG